MEINFTVSSFPTDYCFTTPNQFAVDLVTRLAGAVEGDGVFINYGPTTPLPNLSVGHPWIKLDSAGNIDKVYSYSDGAWVALHPLAPGIVVMYEGSEASIPTFDGGSTGTITATTGPMWEKVVALDARFPLGPGTLPSGAIVNIGDTGGEEKVELIEENIPIDEIIAYSIAEGTNLTPPGLIADDDRNSTPNPDPIHSFGGHPTTGVTVAHNNMPPYKAIWFIRRTFRTHYKL